MTSNTPVFSDEKKVPRSDSTIKRNWPGFKEKFRMRDANTPKVVLFPRRRRAATCSKPLTLELASKAKTMVIQLGMAQHVAAAKLELNPARVNDVIHGRKFHAAPFAPIQDVI
jgi:hypothetical protein